ncbi:nucleotidyltransferase domain-containing protein [Thiohalospira sp.]|uniref:nucleotidyltransferase domain-containing protein n=1 Tax=Thiohalospira sp. TaxID=3080549 RepID=UPI0039813EEE
MRLSQDQTRTVTELAEQFIDGVEGVYLFGSRLDDAARGGDVDLLVETRERPSRLQRARLKQALEDRLGLPVDLLFTASGEEPTAFQRLARERGVRLGER